MPLRLLSTLLLYILVVGYTPGPANLYALSCSLRYGRPKALKMWRGLLVGFVCVVSVVALLSYHLDMAIKPYVLWLRVIGAAYILWLAWRIYHTPLEGDDDRTICNFWSGFIMQLTNVKMIIFEVTVYSIYVIPYSDRLGDYYLTAALLLLAGPIANLAWIFVGGYLRRFFINKMKWVNVIMALLLAGCAFIILFQ